MGHACISNALTIDVEEYFQPTEVQAFVHQGDRGALPSRVEPEVQFVLDLLEQNGPCATFFILGWIAERRPGVPGTCSEWSTGTAVELTMLWKQGERLTRAHEAPMSLKQLGREMIKAAGLEIRRTREVPPYDPNIRHAEVFPAATYSPWLSDVEFNRVYDLIGKIL